MDSPAGAMAEVAEEDGSSRKPCDHSSEMLEQIIQDVIRDHSVQGPEKEQAETFTRNELRKLYDQPSKVSELEAVLRKRITADEARHILFFPDDTQAAYYSSLVADPPEGSSLEHPQRALQIPHLSLLYLHHWKRWGFVSEFVLAGGLHTLACLFRHDNPIVRIKAINTLVNITAHRDFDWFRAPPNHRRRRTQSDETDAGTVEARLHRALLRLRSDSSFISGLIANSWGGSFAADLKGGTGSGARNTFPGICLICLEVLAMWLSWVRALHTVDGKLRLSRPLLKAIEEWAGNERAQEGYYGSTWQSSDDGAAQEGAMVKIKAKTQVPVADSTEATTLTAADLTTETVVSDTKEEESAGVALVEAGSRPNADECQAGHDADSDVKMLLQRDREEHRKVVELAAKLVADFGRFPPAEEDWQEVRDVTCVSGQDGEGEEQAAAGEDNVSLLNNGGNWQGSELQEHPQTTSCLPFSSTAGEGARIDTQSRSSDRSNGNGVAHDEQGGRDVSAPAPVITTTTPPQLVPIEKAQALKEKGNNEFRQGNLKAARKDYSTALDLLNAAQLLPPSEALLERQSVSRSAPLSTPLSKASLKHSIQPTETETLSEGTALGGVLHRNRAAVFLRMFDCAVTTAARAHGKSESSPIHCEEKGNKSYEYTGNSLSENGRDEQSQRGDCKLLGEREGVTLTSSDAKDWSCAAVAKAKRDWEEVRAALELLDQCESDCLKAIEVNTGDKKALFRLATCREKRRLCRRRGTLTLDTSTSDNEEDRRRKDRKAALAAKILARADGVHEIITGLGQKDSRSSLTDDPSTVTPVAAVTAALPSTGDDLKNTPYSRNDVIPARGISDIASDAPCNAAREGGGGRTVTGQTADGPSNAFGGEAWGDAGYEAVTVGRQRVHAADVKTRAGTDRRAPSYGNDDSGHCSVPPRAGTADITAQGVEEGRQKTGLPSRGASNDSARSSGARSEKRTKSKVKAKREGPSSSSSATSLLLSSRQESSASRMRSLRRQLEELAARAAVAARSETTRDSVEKTAGKERGSTGWAESGVGTQEAKEVSTFLMSFCVSDNARADGGSGGGGYSLEKLFGDGVTEESLVGVVRGLVYACRAHDGEFIAARSGAVGSETTGDESYTRQIHQLFVQLARVKRVGLAITMCSTADKEALKEVADHVGRLIHYQEGSRSPHGSVGGSAVVDEKRRVHASFRVATRTLGL